MLSSYVVAIYVFLLQNFNERIVSRRKESFKIREASFARKHLRDLLALAGGTNPVQHSKSLEHTFNVP